MRFGIVTAAVVLGALVGCTEQSVTQTEDGVFVLGSVEESVTTERGITPGGRTIVLEGFSGDIVLHGVSTETASFSFTRVARANNSENAVKLLDKIAINEVGDENVFTVTMSSPEPARTAVEIRADIPFSTPVTIITRSAHIQVADVDGPVSIRNQAGSIEYRGTSASVDLKSRNGDIAIELSTIRDGSTVTLETSNGDILIAVPPGGSMDFDATTSAGLVRNSGLNFATTSLARSGAGGHFTGRVGIAGGSRLIAKTFHGDIAFGASMETTLPAPQEQIVPDDTAETPGDSLVIPADDSEDAARNPPEIP